MKIRVVADSRELVVNKFSSARCFNRFMNCKLKIFLFLLLRSKQSFMNLKKKLFFLNF